MFLPFFPFWRNKIFPEHIKERITLSRLRKARAVGENLLWHPVRMWSVKWSDPDLRSRHIRDPDDSLSSGKRRYLAKYIEKMLAENNLTNVQQKWYRVWTVETVRICIAMSNVTPLPHHFEDASWENLGYYYCWSRREIREDSYWIYSGGSRTW